MATQPLITVDSQHEDMIHDAQFDYYAKKLATCSSDRSIKIYDVSAEHYNTSSVLTGHEGPVWQVSWAHPKFGVLLASCGYDGQVLVWRESPPGVWNRVYGHSFHDASVNGIAWAPHELGLRLAAASSDGWVSILAHQENDAWDVTRFRNNTLGCNAVSWAPFTALGSTDAEGRPVPRVVTGSCDNRVRVWRQAPETGEWEEEMMSTDAMHSDWVRDVAWAPNTGMPCNMIASCGEDRNVYIWTQTEASGPWNPIPLKPDRFEAPVWRVSWSVTGNVLAVSSGDHQVSLWKQDLDGQWVQISNVDEQGPHVVSVDEVQQQQQQQQQQQAASGVAQQPAAAGLAQAPAPGASSVAAAGPDAQQQQQQQPPQQPLPQPGMQMPGAMAGGQPQATDMQQMQMQPQQQSLPVPPGQQQPPADAQQAAAPMPYPGQQQQQQQQPQSLAMPYPGQQQQPPFPHT